MPLSRAQAEYLVATIVAVALLAFLVPAIVHARAGIRDSLRVTDITNLKRAAEMYYNQHVFFPTSPEAHQGCTSSDDKNSWLFGDTSALLKEQHIDAIPHDVRETRGHVYQYCVTDIQNNAAVGFYFQAELEVDQADAAGFDPEPTRNFNYRILHEGNKILYRVCGGTEQQCTPAS